MKKYLSMLLILAMLLPCTLAAADGAMTDKAVNFAEFTFGDTFGNIRKNVKIGSLDFKYGAYTSRCLADAIDNLPDYSSRNENIAPCFKLREEGMRKVAGHDAGAYLWFAYSGNELTDENNAVFYAGEYEFQTNGDPIGVFADLKAKLTQLYGEPFYAGINISDAMGEAGVADIDRYNSNIEEMQPEFAVWKSSVNNTVVVLKNYVQYGDWAQVKLTYISTLADAVLSQYSSPMESGDSSLQGL